MLLRYIVVLVLISLPASACMADGKSNLRFSEAEHLSLSETGDSRPHSIEFAFHALRNVHPIIIAGLMLFLVLGACFLLTDEKEIELYLKIDYRPPKTDILN